MKDIARTPTQQAILDAVRDGAWHRGPDIRRTAAVDAYRGAFGQTIGGLVAAGILERRWDTNAWEYRLARPAEE